MTSPDDATAGRTRLLAVLLAVTALAAIPITVLWPAPADGGDLYSYADIAGDRDLWWGLLMAGATVMVVALPLQALAVLHLVRHRGSGVATAGAVLMWLGAAAQGAGVAGWAAAYFYPTDPDVGEAAGTAVVAAANGDEAHLIGLVAGGAVLVLVGTVVQCVALFRARVVPAWIPVLLLFVVLTFVVPGDGAVGLVTTLPMAAGTIALALHVRRSAG
jgi:hypothetical protein